MKKATVVCLLCIFLSGIAISAQAISFSRHDIELTLSSPYCVLAVDLDQDGDMDVLATYDSNSDILWYENDGNESFTSHVIGGLLYLHGIYAQDMDLDGDIDIVACGSNLRKVSWFENNGAQVFTEHSVSSIQYGNRYFAGGDFDSDGLPDFVIAASHPSGAGLYWYANDGVGSFNYSLIDNSLLDFWKVKTADLDLDGDQDIVVSSKDSYKVLWYANDGTGSFTKNLLTQATVGPRGVEVVDIDRDGDFDVVVAFLASDTLTVYLNDGSQTFTSQNIDTTLDGSYMVEAADLDRDGDIDLVATGLYDNSDTVDLVWYEHDGALNFTRHDVDFDLQGPYDVTLGDMDTDGDLDIIAISVYEGDLAWYENDLNSVDSLSFTAHNVETYFNYAESVVVADVDRDGDNDLVATGSVENAVVWYENDGSESFTRNNIRSSLSGACMAIVEDLDQDGDNDVASVASTAGRLDWFENDGSQSFSPHNLSGGLDHPYDVKALDFDRDGDIDILATSFNDSEVYWYENCTTYYSRHVLATTGGDTCYIHPVDLDLDGDYDIVVSTNWNYDFIWLENDGTMTFTQNVIDDNLRSPIGVAVGDLDNDGDNDLAVCASWGDEFAWYENDGSESFTKHSLITSVGFPFFVSLGDLNFDGNLDMVVSLGGGDQFVWMENTGAKGFTSHVIDGSLSPSFFDIADIDHDGDLDIAAAASGSDLILWYEANLVLSVDLEFFDAFDMEDYVSVTWATSFEKENAGWNLYRAKKGEGYEQINDDAMPAYQFDYQYYDYDVLYGETYCYKLEAIELSGKTKFYGPACLAFGSFDSSERESGDSGSMAQDMFSAENDGGTGCGF